MKIFMLDNYDSFTYNLVQYFQILGCDVTARRCDCTTVDAVFALRPSPRRDCPLSRSGASR